MEQNTLSYNCTSTLGLNACEICSFINSIVFSLLAKMDINFNAHPAGIDKHIIG